MQEILTVARGTAAAALLLGCVVAAGENVVRNPGFEKLSGDGKALVAWHLPRMAGAKFAWDEEVRHAGKRSGRVEGVEPAKQSRFVQAWRQDVGPLGEGGLRLSVWVKAKDVTRGRINVLHKDAKGEVLVNQGVAGFEGTFDWREMGGPLKSVPGAVSLQLVMGLVKSTGTAWFDDVCVSGAGDAGEQLGRATITPAEPQPAGATVPMRVEVVLGKRGLAEGGSIQLRWANWRRAREFRLRKLRAVCEAGGAAFKVTVPPRKKSWPPTPKPIACVATLTRGGPLKEGTRVVISAALTVARHTNVRCGMQVLLSPRAGALAAPLAGEFVARGKGGPASRIVCIAEARPLTGRPGRVTVAVTDRYGNPAADFRGTVRLRCNTDAGLPAEYTFTQADGGSRDLAGKFPGGVVSRVRVTSGEMTAASNPVLPRSRTEPGVYFGDIHSHCELSGDAVGDPDEAYDYARRFWGLDVAALTDHSPRGAKWARAVAAANGHNKAGRFVTFVAFEWSHRVRGHRNAYYRADTGPAQPRDLPDNMQSWWKHLDAKKVRVLTVPHHPNTQSRAKQPDGKSVWGPMDFSVVNHKYQRVVEICQNRGSFEVPGGPKPDLRVVRADCGSSVQTALAKGHRLGFIGSTDTHSGRPGTGAARCAILSADLSRGALWDALDARRCYATSGKHILVLLSLNGQPMGSEIAAKAFARSEVSWRVIGTGAIRRVDLLRNNVVVRSWLGGGKDDVSETFRVDDAPAQTEWWYLRAVQEDREIAWSSPIWLDAARE